MANDIVATELPENITKEFSVDAEGKIFVSKKGLARLCGVQPVEIRKLIRGGYKTPLKTSVVFEPQGFEGGTTIPDILAADIIKHFAYQGKEQAQSTDRLLGAIGLRTFGQKLLNYQAVEKRILTQSEIIELCCLPVPSDWQRRFPEQYYDQLSRLTELKSFGNSRPGIWAKYTKELVYDYLPIGVYDEIKRCKEETGSYEKLHQFLAEDGLKILEQHQRTLLTLMSASSSLTHLKTLLNQSCTGNYQLLLLEK